MKPHPLDGFDDEICDHIEHETRDNLERGMKPQEAHNAALRKFGNVARVMEETRNVWRRVWLEQLVQDIRYGLRFLRRNPRFAAVVVLTMALGIGVNTAVFSVVNTVLLKPVSYPHAERLVWLGAYLPVARRDFVWKGDFPDWRKQTHSYSAMAAFGYPQAALLVEAVACHHHPRRCGTPELCLAGVVHIANALQQIGRASCRERV